MENNNHKAGQYVPIERGFDFFDLVDRNIPGVFLASIHGGFYKCSTDLLSVFGNKRFMPRLFRIARPGFKNKINIEPIVHSLQCKGNSPMLTIDFDLKVRKFYSCFDVDHLIYVGYLDEAYGKPLDTPVATLANLQNELAIIADQELRIYHRAIGDNEDWAKDIRLFTNNNEGILTTKINKNSQTVDTYLKVLHVKSSWDDDPNLGLWFIPDNKNDHIKFLNVDAFRKQLIAKDENLGSNIQLAYIYHKIGNKQRLLDASCSDMMDEYVDDVCKKFQFCEWMCDNFLIVIGLFVLFLSILYYYY